MSKIGIIGAGKMGRTILRGLIAADDNARPWVGVRTQASCDQVRETFGVSAFVDYAMALTDTEILILCVRPREIADLCRRLAANPSLSPSTVIVSVAAGVSSASLERDLDPRSNAVIRAMPNTLCSIGKGMTVLSAGRNAIAADLNQVERVFETIGRCLRLDEVHIDAATALSASSPAFAFLIIEAMAQAGIKLGVTAAVATEMIIQSLSGSAEMVRVSGQHPAVLREQVTTPGGCTIAGVMALEAAGIRTAIETALTTTARVAGALSAPKDA